MNHSRAVTSTVGGVSRSADGATLAGRRAGRVGERHPQFASANFAGSPNLEMGGSAIRIRPRSVKNDPAYPFLNNAEGNRPVRGDQAYHQYERPGLKPWRQRRFSD